MYGSDERSGSDAISRVRAEADRPTDISCSTFGDGTGAGGAATDDANVEIGRASCRERVSFVV